MMTDAGTSGGVGGSGSVVGSVGITVTCEVGSGCGCGSGLFPPASRPVKNAMIAMKKAVIFAQNASIEVSSWS